ncbi:MAG TPA: methionyl-tRNA formyltransferase [Terriglobia bacterium]|nr:methionyl-tRNA formyltransferase [Terriglobia bacterium]
MKLIFCGTPQFAVPPLERLLARNFDVALVLTNPDEPQGRGYALKSPPVKDAALKAGLRVLQPAKLKDARAEIESIKSDAIVVVAYGHLVPQWMIDLPPLGCINLHASILPRYRGAAPIAWAILRGERVTGVTTMKIDAGLDTGDILLQKEIPIEDDDTTGTLSARLSAQGAGLMIETLEGLARGEIQPRPQDHAGATLAPMLKKEDGLIDWSRLAMEIACRVRGLAPWPGAYTSFRGKGLKIWAARVATPQDAASPVPGSIKISGGRLIIGCGPGTALEIIELQMEGRKRIHARDFINGMRPHDGEYLGK